MDICERIYVKNLVGKNFSIQNDTTQLKHDYLLSWGYEQKSKGTSKLKIYSFKNKTHSQNIEDNVNYQVSRKKFVKKGAITQQDYGK